MSWPLRSVACRWKFYCWKKCELKTVTSCVTFFIIFSCDSVNHNTLSRAYLPEVNTTEFSRELEDIDQHYIAPSDLWLLATSEECTRRWPNTTEVKGGYQRRMAGKQSTSIQMCSPLLCWRDELTIQDELIFKSQQIVAPVVTRKELMEKIHASHIGIEGCLRWARETLYWPCMTMEMRDTFPSSMSVCPIAVIKERSQCNHTSSLHARGLRSQLTSLNLITGCY